MLIYRSSQKIMLDAQVFFFFSFNLYLTENTVRPSYKIQTHSLISGLVYVWTYSAEWQDG